MQSHVKMIQFFWQIFSEAVLIFISNLFFIIQQFYDKYIINE